MTSRYANYLLAFLLPLLVIGAGCREETGPIDLVAAVPAEAPLRDTPGQDDTVLHRTLDAMWHNSEGVLMQVFRQTIDCTVGGEFTAHPAGWPEGYDVTLTVDPGTVPLNRPNPVEFVMELPVTGPATATSVPYEFHPDGIRFNQPVHVTVVWPQWAGAAPASGMDLWYLEQETHDGSFHYRVVDREPNQVAMAKAALPQGRYSIDHFSRWNIGGDGSGDGSGTGGVPSDGTLAAVGSGDCCWSELAMDAGRRPTRDF